MQTLKQNVDLIRLATKQIYLVGTAHISQSSTDLVEEVIRQYKPDAIAVELCESRYQSLKDPERWKNTDIVAVVREGRTHVLLAQLILAAFQKKLGQKFHIQPGAEMMKAVSLAGELNADIVLADRDIRTTLKRTWASLGPWSAAKLATYLLLHLFDTKPIDQQEIERLKSSDALEELMREFSDHLPGVRRSLVDERDQYLAEKIRKAPGKNVVAIVGAGHVPGIKDWIERDIDLTALEELPARGKIGMIMAWALLLAILGMIIYGFFTADFQQGMEDAMEKVIAWILATGFFAAIGSALALAHPLTVLASFFSAPITTLHPVLASGWVAGLVEAMIRKPRVSDFESIADDMVSFRRIFANRISRILLIVIFTNLTGTLGAIYGAYLIASML